MQNDTLLITAYAKAPQNTIMYSHNKAIGIVLEVDRVTHRVLDAEFMFVTELAKTFSRKLVIGTDLSAPLVPLLHKIEENLLIPSQQSVIAALRIAQQRYLDTLHGKVPPDVK